MISLIKASMKVRGSGVGLAEEFRGAAGAALGIGLTAWVCRFALGSWSGVPWLLAPLGASAVLVFVMPSSPLAQPWPVVGGQVISTLVGWGCAVWIPEPALAAGMAVGLAIGAMFALGCLHPPGGGMALVAVLSTSVPSDRLLLVVLLNTVLLVAVACVYNPAFRHRYPHRSRVPVKAEAVGPQAQAPHAKGGPRFSTEDLDEALRHYREVLDVSRDDLEVLLHEAEAAAYRRTLGSLRVQDAMSGNPMVVSPTLSIAQAWETMRSRGIKAVPVVDDSRALIGILTRSDCLRAIPFQTADGHNTKGAADSASLTVQDRMSRQVTVAGEDQSLIELLPVFSQAGHHHLPIVDAKGSLVGILTESDVVRALATAVRPDR